VLRVALCADILIGWAGGIDLLVYIARSLKAARPNNNLVLLVPGKLSSKSRSKYKRALFLLKNTVKALIGRQRMKENPDDVRSGRVDELIRRLSFIYPDLEIRYEAGLDDNLAQGAIDMHLDAIYLAMRAPNLRPRCALVGYVPDYQHRHLPRLFSARERAERDRVFNHLIASSDAMVVNSITVAEDMRRFADVQLPVIHPLPFSPNLEPDWIIERPELCLKYGVNGRYFIICNQFWMHKDHITAFRALFEVVREHPDISLICTGNTTDYRDPTYFGKLINDVSRMGLGSHLRFLGHVPKRDQIELLKNALALVQPTLFEGGPGGGSTSEAVALGQKVLLSDLPVNREVVFGDVRFFPASDHGALAKLMRDVLTELPCQRISEGLISQSEARLRRNGLAIWASIESAINKNRAQP
jgi:glycosyltransferase involved in cell wall biosynthesis